MATREGQDEALITLSRVGCRSQIVTLAACWVIGTLDDAFSTVVT